jgi:hypothetical protein
MALGLDCDAERKERRLQERNQIVAARFLGPWLSGPRIGIDIPELLVDVSVFPRDAVTRGPANARQDRREDRQPSRALR